MSSLNITNRLWDYVEAQRTKTKLAGRVYQWLNKDNLGSIIIDGNVFWIEGRSNVSMPNYIYNYIKQWGKIQGLTYLYDLK